MLGFLHVFKSKVLDTPLTEDAKKGERADEQVGLPSLRECDGAIGRLTFGISALFLVNMLPVHLENDREIPIGVLYIYCTIPNRAELLPPVASVR